MASEWPPCRAPRWRRVMSGSSASPFDFCYTLRSLATTKHHAREKKKTTESVSFRRPRQKKTAASFVSVQNCGSVLSMTPGRLCRPPTRVDERLISLKQNAFRRTPSPTVRPTAASRLFPLSSVGPTQRWLARLCGVHGAGWTQLWPLHPVPRRGGARVRARSRAGAVPPKTHAPSSFGHDLANSPTPFLPSRRTHSPFSSCFIKPFNT